MEMMMGAKGISIASCQMKTIRLSPLAAGLSCAREKIIFEQSSGNLQTSLSESWICILLCFMILHVEKSGAFDILVLANFI